MHETIMVGLGIDLSAAWQAAGGAPGSEPTKGWLRDYLRTNPEKDFVIVGNGPRGAYVNGEDCIRQDLSLQIRTSRGGVAMIEFQSTDGSPFHYQAVVL